MPEFSMRPLPGASHLIRTEVNVKGKENPMGDIARYLHEIGVDEKSVGRIEEVMHLYDRLTGNAPVLDVFISDSFGENGVRKLDSLWIFYAGFICEAKNFLASNDFDMSRVSRDSIVYWQIQASGFDFENAQEGSRLAIRVDFNNRVNCILSATGKNCAYLMGVFRRYFSPSEGASSLV
jgi:hypothetical protein